MNAVIEKTMKSLERNNMKAYYAENKAQVCEIVKGMLFPRRGYNRGRLCELKRERSMGYFECSRI